MAADHRLGHRQRLRDRFINGGPEAVADYELLELILFAAYPRGDVKPLAKELLKKFKSFSGVLRAGESELMQVKGFGQAGYAALKVIEYAAQKLLQNDLSDRPILSNWQHVLNYCKISMGHLKNEQLRLLFLDRHHRLICDEVQQEGTIDHTPVYIREVIKRALELGASGLIVVHNHPSGDPTPSKSDISVTQKIMEASEKLGILLHDHVIIAGSKHLSFRTQGLLG